VVRGLKTAVTSSICAGGVSDQLVNAFVIKDVKLAARPNEYGSAVPDANGTRVIDLDLFASIQLDDEHLERHAFDQRRDRLVKVISGHCSRTSG
jgi:hypothetical protein